MANQRRTYSQAEELALTTQTHGRCPRCDRKLFYVKRARPHKAYHLAHIYPLNPTAEESAALAGVIRLSSDVNHPDNIIPLCASCHTEFDKPRTVEEYNELAARKRQLTSEAAQRDLFNEYPIEVGIRRVIDGLNSATAENQTSLELEYNAKSVNDKLEPALPVPVRQKIKHAVADYYRDVRQRFRELEMESPNSSQLIFSQVRAFYLKQKALGSPQAVTFRAVVEWIHLKGQSQAVEPAEILASFFVQNCEVFE